MMYEPNQTKWAQGSHLCAASGVFSSMIRAPTGKTFCNRVSFCLFCAACMFSSAFLKAYLQASQ